MFPHVISIKTIRLHRHFLTFRKELTLGTGIEADLIVNHPFLEENPCTLEVGVPRKMMEKIKRESTKRNRFQGSMEIPDLFIRCRSLKIPAILIALLVTAILCGLVLDKSLEPSAKQNWTGIPLPAPNPYGFCRQDRNHPDGIVYLFKAEKAALFSLNYVPGGNGDGSTISVEVNQTPLLDSALIPDGWGINRHVSIPAEIIQVGENSIRFLYHPKGSGSRHWGIKEVKAVHIPERKVNRVAMEQLFEDSKKILDGNVVSGLDLGRMYVLLSELSIPDHLTGLALRKDLLLKKTEIRMVDKARNAAIKIRSARTLGDENTARELAAQVQSWLPDEWEKGRRILNGS